MSRIADGIAHGIARCRMAYRALFRRRQTERDLHDELALHLEMDTDRNIAAGMSPADAALAARRAFGNVTVIAEQSREARGVRLLDDLAWDVRYASRGLRRRPMFSLAVAGMLAAGIIINTAALSLFNAFFRPIAGPGDTKPVGVEWTRPGRSTGFAFTYDEFIALRERARTLTAVVATGGRQPVVMAPAGGAPPQLVQARFVSDGFFSLFGGTAAIGRTFVAGEVDAIGASPVAVLGHRTWISAFGGDSSIVGRTVVVNGQHLTIVGVADAGFVGDGEGLEVPALWIPLTMQETVVNPTMSFFGGATRRWLTVTARPSPAHTSSELRAELAVLGESLARESRPGEARHDDALPRLEMFRAGPLGRVSVWRQTGALTFVMIGPVLVLLVVCANLANLMLARAAERQQEIGVRVSLGASRGRVVRLLLMEGGLLALAGGLVALGMTHLVLRWFSVSILRTAGHPDPVIAASQVVVDGGVYALTALLVIAVTVVLGLLPALQATRVDLTRIVRDGGLALFGHHLGGSRARGLFVGTQVALSLALLVVAGTVARGARGSGERPDLDVERVLVASVLPSLAGYDSARLEAFDAALVDRLQALPGVRVVARTRSAPYEAIHAAAVHAVEDGANRVWFQYDAVTADYFSTVGLAITRGRAFSASEVERTAPVVVVSEALAEQLWPGRDAIGRFMVWDTLQAPAEVVGIARQAPSDIGPTFFVPLPSRVVDARDEPAVLIGTSGSAAAVTPAVLDAIRAIDPMVYAHVYPLRESYDRNEGVHVRRMLGGAATALGLMALVLAAIGLYGVTAFAVAQRTHEIGIRVALGARNIDVMRAVLSRAARQVGIGVLVGLTLGTLAGMALRAMIAGSPRPDPLVASAIAAVLIAVFFVATWIPARRAAKLDPMVALRG